MIISPGMYQHPESGPQRTISFLHLPDLTAAPALVTQLWINQIAFTHGADCLPILASDGAGPCVLIGGWEGTEKRGFLCHMLYGCAIHSTLQEAVARIAGPESKDREVHIWLSGGRSESSAIPDTRAVLSNLRSLYPNLSVVHDTMGQKEPAAGSLVIDTRVGIGYRLDRQHPAMRDLPPSQMETWEDLQVSVSNAPARITYDSLTNGRKP
ncbi:MAG: hypothetical protein J0M12_15760 [Deltaproteobacteria bacterium]|nr:hypothetical protein [Deltaproteobacteria bacterium]